MIALYLIVVLAGCIVPFFIEDNESTKSKLYTYADITLLIIVLLVAVKSGMAGLPFYDEIENITIGIGVIILATFVAKLHRIGKTKKKKKASQKTHRAAS